MEFFQKAKIIRLRSFHDKYLLANDDQKTVCLHRNGSMMNSKWEVEILENSKIRFKSCYRKYLTASNMSILFGATGKTVQQTMPTNLDSSIEWEPIRDGFQVRLKSCHGKYLRANRGLPPLRNSLTHDIPRKDLTKDWILWDVDVVELHPFIMKPQYRPQSIVQLTDSFLSSSSSLNLPKLDLGTLLKIELQPPP